MSKTVIYTAIYGGKDSLVNPPAIEGCDYVCFTDDQAVTADIWKIHYMPGLFGDNGRMNAKVYKVLPHKYLKDYEYSVWIDGNFTPDKYGFVEFVTSSLQEKSLAVFKHHNSVVDPNDRYFRDCLFDEAEICMQLELDNPDTILRQVQKYEAEGFPINYGLFAATITLRKHNDPKIIEVMESWWQEINNFSSRDQISFPYVLAKHNIQPHIIHGNAFFGNKYFTFTQHKIEGPHNEKRGHEFATWLEDIRYFVKTSGTRYYKVYQMWKQHSRAITFRKWFDEKLTPKDVCKILISLWFPG